MLANQRHRSLAGVIAAMAVVNLVYGISFPLLALVLDAQGVGKSLIGQRFKGAQLAAATTAFSACWCLGCAWPEPGLCDTVCREATRRVFY